MILYRHRYKTKLRARRCSHCGGIFIPNVPFSTNCRRIHCIRARGRKSVAKATSRWMES